MLAFIFDSVSFSEWFVLLVVFLIVVGPRKIPETARTLGNYYSKFRRAAESFKRQLLEMETEFNKAANEAGQEIEGAFVDEGDLYSPKSEEDPDFDPSAVYPGQSYASDEPAADSEETLEDNGDEEVKAEPQKEQDGDHKES
ncbi:MAG: twin-arginine translocase TatA/TatE family subunit [Kiritimatiellae bacterium]|nr:twin-arginine translocase TatA/TatE family subunit [Kiritimatiellia bacterium]